MGGNGPVAPVRSGAGWGGQARSATSSSGSRRDLQDASTLTLRGRRPTRRGRCGSPGRTRGSARRPGSSPQIRLATSTPTPSLGKKVAGGCSRQLPMAIQSVSVSMAANLRSRGERRDKRRAKNGSEAVGPLGTRCRRGRRLATSSGNVAWRCGRRPLGFWPAGTVPPEPRKCPTCHGDDRYRDHPAAPRPRPCDLPRPGRPALGRAGRVRGAGSGRRVPGPGPRPPAAAAARTTRSSGATANASSATPSARTSRSCGISASPRTGLTAPVVT